MNGNGDDHDTGVPDTEITAKAARQLNGFNAYNDFAVNGLSSWDFDFDGPGGTGTRYRAYTDNSTAITKMKRWIVPTSITTLHLFNGEELSLSM